jgi:hypothetical protein
MEAMEQTFKMCFWSNGVIWTTCLDFVVIPKGKDQEEWSSKNTILTGSH